MASLGAASGAISQPGAWSDVLAKKSKEYHLPILSLFRRARRYLNVYAWVVRQHLRFHPALFLTQQVLAVGARLGTIAGLIACAHFLAHLIAAAERPAATHALGLGLELTDSEYKAAMVLVPVVLLLVAALSQHLATILLGRLVNVMTTALSDDYAERMSNAKMQIPVTSGRGYMRLLSVVLRTETRFLVLVQNVLIVCGVVIGSILVVGPLIALGVIVLLIAFVGVFLLFRQKHAHELQGKLRELDRKRIEIIKMLDDPAGAASGGEFESGAHRGSLREISGNLYERFYLAVHFRELSRTATMIVQAGLIAALLLYVATTEIVEPSQFARLVSFFVIMRFAFGTVQGINASALAIAPDYPSLVRIMEGKDYLDVPGTAATAEDEEEAEAM